MKNSSDTDYQSGIQELWHRFECTGSVQQYLCYKRACEAGKEDYDNADHSDGPGGERGEGGGI